MTGALFSSPIHLIFAYPQMRSDLGGVRFTPTILVVFYGDNGISRAKYEGRAEVQNV